MGEPEFAHDLFLCSLAALLLYLVLEVCRALCKMFPFPYQSMYFVSCHQLAVSNKANCWETTFGGAR